MKVGVLLMKYNLVDSKGVKDFFIRLFMQVVLYLLLIWTLLITVLTGLFLGVFVAGGFVAVLYLIVKGFAACL